MISFEKYAAVIKVGAWESNHLAPVEPILSTNLLKFFSFSFFLSFFFFFFFFVISICKWFLGSKSNHMTAFEVTWLTSLPL